MSLATTNQSSPAKSPSKMQMYAEKDGAESPGQGSAMDKQKTHMKFTFDHLGVDVPSDAMMKEIFDYFDKDGNGAISLNEFREIFSHSFDNFGAPMEERDVDRLFAKLDRGTGKGARGDGKLHFDEFCILLLSKFKA